MLERIMVELVGDREAAVRFEEVNRRRSLMMIMIMVLDRS